MALRFVPGVGDQLLRTLVDYFGSAGEVFRQPAGRLTRLSGIGEHTARAIKSGNARGSAEEEFKKAEKHQTRIVFYHEPAFPLRLQGIADAPCVLYIRGHLNLNRERFLGIVGTRKATDYGRRFTDAFIRDLVPYQPVVLSGLAYGIDIRAHQAALEAGLPTVAVIGSGMDRIYPWAHADTAMKMLGNGALVTEQRFGAQPDAHHFPARNRIIAGLCDALVVVEASEKGGALITADIAASYNRDIFAVPGNVDQSSSAGCNKLIRNQQAQLITAARELEFHLNWSAGATERGLSNPEPVSSDPVERLVMNALNNTKGLHIDELQAATELQAGTLATCLLQLELNGKIKALPGRVYRNARPERVTIST
ncbi:MAG: DNA-processing protein DprA [Bacteroidota bacterium]